MKLPVYDYMSTYEKYFGKHNLKKWQVFFDFISDNKLEILDFGCGSGWSIHLGRQLGHDISGLDIKNWSNFNEFNEFRIALGVDKYVTLYKGIGTLPFSDNSFSVIVCKATFNQHYNTEGLEKKDLRQIILKRITEFSRILKEPGIVVITGDLFLNYKKEFLDANLKNTYIWKRDVIEPVWKD